MRQQGRNVVNRTLDDSLSWTRHGTNLLLEVTADLSDSDYNLPSLLSGWTRKHLVAHIAANAEALCNLVHWATTGEETPMYKSPQERAAGIARGPRMSANDLNVWLRRSAGRLDEGLSQLNDDQWAATVTTAQGRSVPATELPWMRSREVCVHAVDLDLGIAFADLPEQFLVALRSDVIAKRGSVPQVDGPLDQHVAWLTGRPHQLPKAPKLEAWL